MEDNAMTKYNDDSGSPGYLQYYCHIPRRLPLLALSGNSINVCLLTHLMGKKREIR